MNTIPTSYQPGTFTPSGRADSESSELAAGSSGPPSFLGYPLSSVHPSPSINSVEMSVTQATLKKKANSSGQTQSVRNRKIDDTIIDVCDLISHKQVSVKKPGHYPLANHFASLRKISPPYQPFPKSVSNMPMAEQFTEFTVRCLQGTNTPYAARSKVMTRFFDHAPRAGCNAYRPRELLEARKSLGVFYPEDYHVRELPGLSGSRILGMHSLPEYFDQQCCSGFVANDNGHTPSESLNAFFHGPTVADCATTLLACQYRAIESIIGTDEFNRIFGAPVSKFRISFTLFEPPERFADNSKLMNAGNPIYYLFENLEFINLTSSFLNPEKLSELDIKKGDILYIHGVDRYCKKHKTGNAIGFNLICTGQNSSGHNLYLGFGPDDFAEPKTCDQIKKILIDGYNKPQSPETIRAIAAGETDYAQLSDDTLPDDHPIVGITLAFRFSTARWKYFVSQTDQAWHKQPPLPVTPAMEPKPVHHGSPFPSENLVADLDKFKHRSPQQERMKEVALRFSHAVINNQGKTPDKKPMGLFLTGSPGLGKTHLCVAVAKKAADYGVNTLYIDIPKATALFQNLGGHQEQWHRDIDAMLAGKDLVVIDDANGGFFSEQLLAKTMKIVMTENTAIMVSSNHHIPIKEATPGFVDPFAGKAHNFVYLNDLQGDSYRSQWWHSPEARAADALSQLGQYQGDKAAGVITEDAVSIDDIARILSIPVDQIRRVAPPHLPGGHRISPDYYLSDLTKTQHQAVFMACDMTGHESVYSCGKIEQFLNVIQRVHDQGMKLVVKTNNRLIFSEKVLGLLKTSLSDQENELRITDRLEHMFRDFS
ncbi:ATP-binding protein [Endozoicomonas sp. ONNA2]|uniref:ATP-binding protein n=1 Tax=Endozoicomonas sp. ONNA2 TaxID=2828741 RepID=UPI0021488D78|nr:ATP-binding protein [Endozoicomonas sp. ONNA2]